jgi:hypothetical protein
MGVFHCVVTPILVVTAPLFGQLLDNPVLEIGALLGSILCGMSVIYKGYCTHKRRHTVLLFAAGAIVWVTKKRFRGVHEIWPKYTILESLGWARNTQCEVPLHTHNVPLKPPWTKRMNGPFILPIIFPSWQ